MTASTLLSSLAVTHWFVCTTAKSRVLACYERLLANWASVGWSALMTSTAAANAARARRAQNPKYRNVGLCVRLRSLL